MFACSLYPSTPEFLSEVREEVDYQVRRLGHHACIALWCGDNELLGALTTFKDLAITVIAIWSIMIDLIGRSKRQ